MDYEIQRFCWFDTCGKQGSSKETIWKHKRAIEGHKFILVDFDASVNKVETQTKALRCQIYDGNVYSHWGSFPGIYDQSTLRLAVLNPYTLNVILPLNNWECKEFTMSVRNADDTDTRQFLIVVYFYEIPMTKAEAFEYAVKQPRYKIRHGSARTLDRFED